MMSKSGFAGMIHHALAWCCIAAGAIPGIAAAAFPDRPITMIIAFVPGGGTDVVARALAPYIEKQLGPNARIVIVNRGGAGGEIGFTALASAAPDGYTIGFINSPSIQTILIERAAQYTMERFELIGNVVDDPASLSVYADSPIKDLAGLVAHAKANPGALAAGTPGVGAPGHLVISLLGKLTGAKINHVPYKGAGDVRAPMAGKQIQLAAVSIGESLQAIKGGMQYRILAQMSAARSTLAPDVPTAKEQGIDLEMSSLRGIAAPKGLSADVRDILVRAVERAVNDPEFRVKSVQYYAPLRYLAPREFDTALKESDVQLRQLWKESPWTDK
jgi:tripartite-type tricarboxylate transporter receptor subunit TctC